MTNRLQAVLEDATSKLAAVVTDVRGLWAREILQRLLEGETDAQALAELARGRLRAKREALAHGIAAQAREVALATLCGKTAIEVAIIDRQGSFLARVGG